MMVRSGSVTASPKASPGCKGDGEGGPAIGGAAGGIGSPALGCAKAGPVTKTSATANRAARRVHDIGILRHLRRSGDSPVIGILAWFILAYGQSMFIRHINRRN